MEPTPNHHVRGRASFAPLFGLLIAALLTLHLANPATGFANDPPNEYIVRIPIADEVEGFPILCIYVTPGRAQLERDFKETGIASPRIIIAVWEDGTMIWSENKVGGGPPYLTATVDSRQLEDFLTSIGEIADSLPSGIRTDYRGPDSAATTIVANGGECQVYWHSWHEVWEATGRSVSVNGYIRPLPPGQSAEEVRTSESSPEYLQFVNVWEEVKTAALSLIPRPPPEPDEIAVTFRKRQTTMVLDP